MRGYLPNSWISIYSNVAAAECFTCVCGLVVTKAVSDLIATFHVSNVAVLIVHKLSRYFRIKKDYGISSNGRKVKNAKVHLSFLKGPNFINHAV